MNGYDSWKTIDSLGEDAEARAEEEWASYELWANNLKTSDMADDMADFLDSLKVLHLPVTENALGLTQRNQWITAKFDGWQAFQEWQFGNRWPGDDE